MDTNAVVNTGMTLYGQKIFIESTGNKEKDQKNALRIKETIQCYIDQIGTIVKDVKKDFESARKDFLSQGLDDPMHSVPKKETYYGPESDEVYRDGIVV